MFDASGGVDGNSVDGPLLPPRSPIGVMPLPFSGWDPKHPWRRSVLLEVFRADQRAAAEAGATAGSGPVDVAEPPRAVVGDFEAEFGLPLPEVPADLLVEPEGWLG
jgi:hypothetical protein